MSDVIGRIDGFGLRSDCKEVNCLRRYPRAHFAGECFDGIQFLSIGEVMYAIDEGSTGSDGSCDGPVSEEHKFLNELMCFVMRFEIDFYGIAMFVKSEVHFVLFDSERSGGQAFRTEFLRKRVESHDSSG